MFHNLTVLHNTSELVQISYYTVFVVIGLPLNLWSLVSLSRRYLVCRTRIFLLQLQLNISDIMVLCFHATVRVIWLSTFYWLGGTILCKVTKFLELTSILFSSNVIVCIGAERFSALQGERGLVARKRRVLRSVLVAWCCAISCALPQIFFFDKVSDRMGHSQCMFAEKFQDNRALVIFWGAFVVLLDFWLPATITLFMYIQIARKVHQMLYSEHPTTQVVQFRYATANLIDSSLRMSMNRVILPRNERLRAFQNKCTGTSESLLGGRRYYFLLRSIALVVVYIICWLPHAILATWSLVDGENYRRYYQDKLYFLNGLMVFNSVINPLIYGYVPVKRLRFM